MKQGECVQALHKNVFQQVHQPGHMGSHPEVLWWQQKPDGFQLWNQLVLKLSISKSLGDDWKCGGQGKLLYVPSPQYLNSACAFQTLRSINTHRQKYLMLVFHLLTQVVFFKTMKSDSSTVTTVELRHSFSFTCAFNTHTAFLLHICVFIAGCNRSHLHNWHSAVVLRRACW